MDNNNPIKYSDLISPDDSLEKLVKQLDEISSALQLVQKSAVSLNESMKTMSGATSEGRSAIAAANKEAEKLAKAQADLAFAESEAAKKIAELKEATREQNNLNKLAAKEANSAAGSYNALSAQYSRLKMQLNQMSEEERKNTKIGREMVAQSKQLYDKMKELQEVTGKHTLNVGNYTSALKGLPGPLGSVANGISGVVKQARAFIATPVGAVVAAVTGAFLTLKTALNATESSQQKLAKVTGFLKGALNGIIEVVVQAGDVLYDVFSGNWSKLAKDAKEVKDAFMNIGNVAKESAKIAEAEKQLEQNMNKFIAEKARLELERAKYEKESKDALADVGKRKKALDSMLAVDEKIYQTERKFLTEQINLLKQKQKLTSNNTEDNKEMYELQAQLYNLETEHVRKQMQADKTNARIVNQQKKDTKELEAEKKQAYNDELKRLKLSAEAQVAFSQEQYDITVKMYEKEREHAIESGTSVQDAWLEYVDKMQILDDKYSEHLDKADAERTKKRKEQAVNALKTQKANAELEIEQMKGSEAKKAKLRLEAELDYQEKRLKLAQEGIIEMSEAEVSQLKIQILKLKKDISQETKADSIWDLMGFSFTSEEQQALDTAIKSATDSVKEYTQSIVDLKTASVESSKSRVESAKKALEAEIEARNQGLANNVETAQKELENAKKMQDKALTEQKKAQRAKALIDSAEQTSSLITASANIWKAWGTAPAVAISSIALMWSSFLASKIKATQVSSAKTETYGDGTVEMLQGGSHYSGNDIDLGSKPDGTRRRAEGGEYFAVINKRSSRKYRSVIPDVVKSLNNDTFASKFLSANSKMGGIPIVVNTQNKTDLKFIEKNIKEIKDQNVTKTFIDGKGNLVRQSKGFTQIIHRT